MPRTQELNNLRDSGVKEQAAGSGQATGKKAFGRIRLGGFGCSASLEKRAGGKNQPSGGSLQQADKIEFRISNCECRMAKLTDSMTQELKRLNGRREGAAGRG
jgi:hypothetical protein